MAVLNKEKRRLLAHILAAVIILIHGYEKMGKGESSYWIFYLFGGIFLLLVAIHKQLASRFKWIDGTFYGIEAVLFLITAYDYFQHGKMALPLCYVGAAVGYVIATIVVSKRNIRAGAMPH